MAGEHTAVLAPISSSAVWGRGVGCVKFDKHLFIFNLFLLLHTFTNYPIFVYFTYYLMIVLGRLKTNLFNHPAPYDTSEGGG